MKNQKTRRYLSPGDQYLLNSTGSGLLGLLTAAVAVHANNLCGIIFKGTDFDNMLEGIVQIPYGADGMRAILLGGLIGGAGIGALRTYLQQRKTK